MLFYTIAIWYYIEYRHVGELIYRIAVGKILYRIDLSTSYRYSTEYQSIPWDTNLFGSKTKGSLTGRSSIELRYVGELFYEILICQKGILWYIDMSDGYSAE